MLDDTVVPARRLLDQLAFFERQRQGLFDVDVFACLHRPDPAQGVPVGRRGVEDDVERLVFDHLPHVGVDRRTASAQLLEFGRPGRQRRGVDIAERRHFDVLVLHSMQRPGQEIASPADAGDAGPDTIIGGCGADPLRGQGRCHQKHSTGAGHDDLISLASPETIPGSSETLRYKPT